MVYCNSLHLTGIFLVKFALLISCFVYFFLKENYLQKWFKAILYVLFFYYYYFLFFVYLFQGKKARKSQICPKIVRSLMQRWVWAKSRTAKIENHLNIQRSLKILILVLWKFWTSVPANRDRTQTRTVQGAIFMSKDFVSLPVYIMFAW